jgi:uncharacterized membrane protein YheB (UPF0754 family)
MEALFTIIFMAVIGAVIGGATNSLAIKMLFRPYEAKYIGKWRIPFTPGLIPKRRNELSTQLGLLVVNHLLTAETLQVKLREGKIYDETKDWLSNKVRAFFQTDESLGNILYRFGVKNAGTIAEEKLIDWLQKKLAVWKKNNGPKTLGHFVPQTIWESIDGKIEEATEFIISKFKIFIMSPKGHELIQQNVDRFFEGRGMLAGLLQSFLDKRNIADRIQEELVKMANNEQTKAAIQQLLRNELDEVKNWTVLETINKFEYENWMRQIWEQIQQKRVIQQWLDNPVSSLPTYELQEKLINDVLPESLDKGIQLLSLHVEKLLNRLELDKLIKKQVDTFPTKRLEELVLGISKREFKMITFLGAYIGGLIGIVQGILVLFMN